MYLRSGSRSLAALMFSPRAENGTEFVDSAGGVLWTKVHVQFGTLFRSPVAVITVISGRARSDVDEERGEVIVSRY